MTSQSQAASVSRPGVYADLGARARPAHPVLALLIVLLILAFSLVVATVVVVAFMFASGAFSAVEPGGDPTAALNDQMAPMLAVLILSLFPAMALGAVFWGTVVEKRSFASLGFSGPSKLLRYARGLGRGAGLALLLMGLSAGLAMLTAGEAASAEAAASESVHLERLAQAAFLIPLAITGLIFFVQSASEEIVFRGWLLSSLAARAGLGLSIALSSLMFGFFHIDRLFVAGPLIGLLVVAGTGAVGLAFAVWALREGGIFGVMGAHGGFNATLILTELAALAASGEEARSFSQIVVDIQTTMLESLSEPGAAWGVLVQVVVFVGLAMILAPGLKRGRA